MARILFVIFFALILLVLIIISSAISIAGWAAATAIVLWLTYRGRFPIKLLLEEAPESLEDATPALGCLLMIGGGIAYGIGHFAGLDWLRRAGLGLAVFPLIAMVLTFIRNPQSLIGEEDAGLAVLNSHLPRIQLLSERIRSDEADPRLQPYRHAWRADLLGTLLVQRPVFLKSGSAAAKAAFQRLTAEMDVRAELLKELQVLGEPSDPYLTGAVRRIHKCLDGA